MQGKRILHVVGGMNLGGAETWLMHVLRSLSGAGVQTDFLVHTDKPCVYDAEIRSLGGQIWPCLTPVRPLIYAWHLQKILRRGHYDVIHSHVHHFSGLILNVADWLGVPLRIAHSHNDTSSLDTKVPAARRAYLQLMKHWIKEHATAGLAVSQQSAAALFGAHWVMSPRWRILYCGINLEPFHARLDRKSIRAELGLPANAFVIGHVGRFDAQKNHAFLINIFAALARLEKNARLLLVGAGPLQEGAERQAEALKVRDKIIFAGLRRDVPGLMRGAMDLFLFPSLHEGLPLVLMEAQAAGLPCVISDTLPTETDAVPELITRLSLRASAEDWAGEISRMHEFGSVPAPEKSLAAVEKSPFNIRSSVAALKEVYGLA
jgi:glycosyltransferase involved in cell wall biosynthesis